MNTNTDNTLNAIDKNTDMNNTACIPQFPTILNQIVPTNEQRVDFYKRLIKAKLAFDPIVRDVEAYGYKYADLENVIKATDTHLHANNIMIQETNIEGILSIWLVDAESGARFCEFAREITSVSIKDKQGNAKNNELQAEGAGITYLRRYGRLIVLGLAMEDDDVASNTQQVTVKQKYSPEQLKDWHEQLRKLNDDGLVSKNDLTKLAKLKLEPCKDQYGDLMFSIIRESRKQTASTNEDSNANN